MSLSIEKLQELSNKLEERITYYRDFSQSESDFGKFMKVASIELGLASNNIISLEQTFQYILVDGQRLLTSLIAMNDHLASWKSQVDLKIEELKNQEFPSEIIL